MPEIKTSGKSMAQRVTDRLKNSGEGANPDVHVLKGDGPTRTHTNIHHSGKNEGSTSKQNDRG
jgi:hypothetical protein